MFDFEHYTDSEIVQMVVNPEQQACEGGSSDENEDAVQVAERVSIELTGELLKGLEQCSYIYE